MSSYDTPLIGRESSVFSPLDPIYKWEFTRRHPYYVKNWKLANQYWAYQADLSTFNSLNASERRRLSLAWQLMQLIGANASSFPNPEIDARTNSEFAPPFTHPVAKAMRHRDWLFLAMFLLPDRVRRAVAYTYLEEIARETVSVEGRDLMRAVAEKLCRKPPEELELGLREIRGTESLQDRLIDGICRLDAPELDKEFPGMLFVNYNVPTEDILRDVKETVQRWKDEMGVVDRRRRANKWDAYLEAWDLREGWMQGRYDGQEERRLQDIAQELGISKAKVQAHHRAAFKLITGHEYDPECWAALFGTVKFGTVRSKWGSWRQTKKRQTVRNSKSDTGASTNSGPAPKLVFGVGWREVATSDEDIEYVELLNDMKALIDLGRTDEEIELELTVASDAVEYFRTRYEDGLI